MLIAKGDHVKFNYNRRYSTVVMTGTIEKIGKKFAYIKVEGIIYVGAQKIITNAVRVPFVDVLEVVK